MKSSLIKGLRHFSRVAFDAPVSLHLPDRTLSVHLIDIALKGALVETNAAQTLVLQAPCRLVLPLTEGGDSIEMRGKIVHLEGLHVGIECQEIDVVSLTRLRRLIELNASDPSLVDRELSHLFISPRPSPADSKSKAV
jgi:hypothetical protein